MGVFFSVWVTRAMPSMVLWPFQLPAVDAGGEYRNFKEVRS